MSMKKSKLILPLALMLVVLTAILVACGKTTYSGSYSVKYVVDGSVEKSATIENKSDINGYFTPEKEGFNFEGWYLDKNFTTPLTNDTDLKENVALYAKLSKKSYTVKFIADGQVIETVSVLYCESATAPNPPEIQSKVFSKWDTDFSSVKSDLVVNAIYTENASYTASFMMNGEVFFTYSFKGGEKTQSVADKAFDVLEIPKGFEFVSWATLFDKAIPETLPERDVEYKAVLQIADINPTLDAPYSNQIDFSPNNLIFTANHQKFDGIEYKYQWYLDGIAMGNESEVSFKTPDVGDHKLKVTVTASSQWTNSVSKNVTYDFVVNTATLTSINATDCTFEYDGKAHNIAVETMVGDKVEYRVDGGNWSSSLNIVNAGEYPVYVRLTRKNYHPHETATPIMLTITKKVVSGTIVTKTISYGDSLPTSYKVNYSGFVGTDNASVFSGDIIFTASAKNSLTLGTYSVSGDTSGHIADNYTLSLSDGTLEITKRVLKVVADSKSINFGDPLPTLTISYEGFAPGEGVDDLDKAPVAVCGYAQGGTAGKYEITVSGGESEHYHFVYEKGTLTVAKGN